MYVCFFVCRCACMSWYACGSQRTVWGSWLSFSTMWIAKITQVLSLGGKHAYLLSPLSSLAIYYFQNIFTFYFYFFLECWWQAFLVFLGTTASVGSPKRSDQLSSFWVLSMGHLVPYSSFYQPAFKKSPDVRVCVSGGGEGDDYSSWNRASHCCGVTMTETVWEIREGWF